jgi:hypothetical protein
MQNYYDLASNEYKYLQQFKIFDSGFNNSCVVYAHQVAENILSMFLSR